MEIRIFFLFVLYNSVIFKVRGYQLKTADCTREGYQCVNSCKSLILCIDQGGENLHPISIEDCETDSEYFCSTESLDCKGTFCADSNDISLTVECGEKGSYYPHPFNCSQFITYCGYAGEVPVIDSCRGNYGFNPLNHACDVPLFDTICKNGPVPKCTALHQTGALPSNPQIFYICKKNSQGYLYPYQYNCAKGLFYDSNLMKCVTKLPTTTIRSNKIISPTAAPMRVLPGSAITFQPRWSIIFILLFVGFVFIL